MALIEFLIFVLILTILYIIYTNLYIPPVINYNICDIKYSGSDVIIELHFIDHGTLQDREKCCTITKRLYINTSKPINKITKFILKHPNLYGNEMLVIREQLRREWNIRHQPVLTSITVKIEIL